MNNNRYYLKRLFEYFYLPYQIMAAVLIIITTVLSLLAPAITKLIIDEVITKGHYEMLSRLGMVLVGITAIATCFEFVQSYMINRISETISKKMREDIYNKALQLDQQTVKKWSLSNIVSLFNNDINQINILLISFTTRFVVQVITLVLILVCLFMINVKLTLLSLVTIPVYFLCFTLIKSKLLKQSTKKQTIFVELNKHLQEDIGGLEVIQALVAEWYKKSQFCNALDRMFKASLKLSVLNAGLGQVASFVASMGVVIVIWVGASMTQSNAITLGGILAFTMYLGRLYSPILSIVSVNQAMLVARPSLMRVINFLDLESSIQDSEGSVTLEGDIEKIELKDIVVKYDGDKEVLEKVNMTFEGDKFTAIVGESGSGKTTVGKLIMRMINPDSGDICFNGLTYQHYQVSSIRSKIGYAHQSATLFTGSIKENIVFDLQDIEDAQISKAIECVHADFVNQLEQGAEALIGENGFNFSGGEKQRLALGRVLIRENSMLLLDEPTSSVDNITRKTIIDNISSRAYKGIIMVTHRLEDVVEADMIYVMDKGKVVGTGTHESLLANNQYYQNLYYNQTAAVKETAV